MYPVFLLTAPDIARALIGYRTRRLTQPRTTPASTVQRRDVPVGIGAHRLGGDAGLADTSEEHHITLDVAFACIQYAYASGDELFLAREIWPLLAQVCTWVQDRVVRTQGYEIHHVVGVDEGTRNVNNNSYTNIAAKIVLAESDRMPGV